MRRIVVEEALRATAVIPLAIMGWAYLSVNHFLPASGWSFAALVLGMPLIFFSIMVAIRRKTGRELKLRGWALVAILAGSWVLFMLARMIFAR